MAKSNAKLPPRSGLEREVAALVTGPPPMTRTAAKAALAARYGVTFQAVEQRLYRPEAVDAEGLSQATLDNAYAVIVDVTRTTNYPPSLRVLAERLGVSTMTARTIALALAEAGRILYQGQDEGGAGIQLRPDDYAKLAAVP